MENILKIVYDKSLKHTIINLSDIEKLVELLIIDKDLNEYVSNISVQQIRGNNLASYSNYTKQITIYSNVIEVMIGNMDKNSMLVNDFEKILYKNLSILQVILHEIEHANQEKTSYSENSLEAFLLRIANLVSCDRKVYLYECDPNERLAEIKSYNEIIELIYPIKNQFIELSNILKVELLKRNVRGYHYQLNNTIEYPVQAYFTMGQRSHLLETFDWYDKYHCNSLKKSVIQYDLIERFKYGFPITLGEYSTSLKQIFSSPQKIKIK